MSEKEISIDAVDRILSNNYYEWLEGSADLINIIKMWLQFSSLINSQFLIIYT